ncbi:MAG: C15orf41 family protein [Thermoplasmata archaeon]|nr:C15orf41 family protein [Thermoplasmata archaeon]
MNDSLTFSKHDYVRIYRQLRTMDDVKRLSSELDEELLFVIYTQRTVREVKKEFHNVARSAPAFRRWWRKGMTFQQIASKIEFPPVLTAMLILRLDGIGRKTFQNFVHDPSKAPTKRLRREMAEVVAADRLYSPEGHELQRQRGEMGEAKLAEWIDGLGLTYRREADLRKEFQKTPDFLLERPIYVRGSEVRWVESKASFGDTIEVRNNLRKQLEPYRDIFGPGMVIYWYGIVPYDETNGILVATRRITEPDHAHLINVTCSGNANGP